jgi:hypothetical protein
MLDGVPYEPTLYAAEEEAPQSAEWCVELGDVIAAMCTSDLTAAIERGDVTQVMRVWRMGLEAWTPVHELPELAPR